MTAIELATTVWGDGERRALLLHGVTSNAAGWWRIAPDLAAAGYQVVAPDLRGHGSTPTADDMSLGAMRDDVLALGGSWDLVIAHSLGGAIALMAVLSDPEWTTRLVLEDPALEAPGPDATAEWFLRPFQEPPTVAAIGAANPGWDPTDVAIKVDALRETSPDGVEATARQSAPWNLWPDLATIRVPTLLLGADPARDPLVTPEAGAAAAAANPAVTFITIPNGSHSIHRDAYPEFWEAVAGFIG